MEHEKQSKRQATLLSVAGSSGLEEEIKKRGEGAKANAFFFSNGAQRDVSPPFSHLTIATHSLVYKKRGMSAALVALVLSDEQTQRGVSRCDLDAVRLGRHSIVGVGHKGDWRLSLSSCRESRKASLHARLVAPRPPLRTAPSK